MPIHHDEQTRQWNRPELIGELVAKQAAFHEDNTTTHNAGEIVALSECVVAAHRCAEAMEATNKLLRELCDHVKSWLPSPK